MMPAIRWWCVRALLVSSFYACGGGGNGPTGPGPGPGPNPQPGVITMTATAFSPSSVTIQSGGTVTWNNTSGVLHNVTFSTSGSPANIPDHSSGSNSRTFPNNGTFAFTCTIHPATMNGSVSVQ